MHVHRHCFLSAFVGLNSVMVFITEIIYLLNFTAPSASCTVLGHSTYRSAIDVYIM